MSIQLPEKLQRQARGNPVNEPLALHIARLFSSEESHGASLLIAALRVIPFDQFQEYHPHTIRLELQTELKLKEIDDDIMSRLMAASAILFTDLFYNDVSAFIEICNNLGDAPPLPGFFDPADSTEMAAAVAQSQIIDPIDGRRDIDFSAEVLSYIGIQLHEEGFVTPPMILQEAIMPIRPRTTEITDNADLMEVVITADQDRHAEIESVVSTVLSEIKTQISPLFTDTHR